ncbi:MAG: hypothetical protein H7328_10955 [Bdellovibrio sp.]|nr:hypothetical protein [Bdellovibrio sp.]
MKNLVSFFALLSISSTVFAGAALDCSIKSDLVDVPGITVPKQVSINISESRKLLISLSGDIAYVALLRPATEQEKSDARWDRQIITQVVVASKAIETQKMSSAEMFMAEDVKVSCKLK